jgi:hypothetical protein
LLAQLDRGGLEADAGDKHHGNLLEGAAARVKLRACRRKARPLATDISLLMLTARLHKRGLAFYTLLVKCWTFLAVGDANRNVQNSATGSIPN